MMRKLEGRIALAGEFVGRFVVDYCIPSNLDVVRLDRFD